MTWHVQLLLGAGCLAIGLVALKRSAVPRRALPALAAVLVSLALLGPRLAEVAAVNIAFVHAGVQDTSLGPLPEEFVEAASAELWAGDSWSLVTPMGQCQDDAHAFQWLAFRLLPRQADCDDPDVMFFWQVEVPSNVQVEVLTEEYAIDRR